MRTLFSFLAIALMIVLVAWLELDKPDLPLLDTSSMKAVPEPGEEFSGGATSVPDTSRKAFGRPLMNLARDSSSSQWFVFVDGKGIFDRDWSSVKMGRGALGPRFNAVSCNSCHEKDGRGRPPLREDEEPRSLVMMLSVHDTAGGRPVPHPAYGPQLRYHATGTARPDGTVEVSYDETTGEFADGTSYSLVRPIYTFRNLARGPVGDGTLVSPRVAPFNFGMGLLEAIPAAAIISRADPDDADGDGISGRPNYVDDVRTGKRMLGRFGWKAGQAMLEQQALKAFANDMGIMFDNPPAMDRPLRLAGNSGTMSELRTEELDLLLRYLRLLAVPKRRNWLKPEVLRGKAIFNGIGCTGCHTPSYTTSSMDGAPELSLQTIRPYTDLLLHDMGDDLADGRPDGLADGREWRTPPLWGIGLVKNVNGHTRFLHDGRARNLEEAVLWHGGEAERARAFYRRLSGTDRGALMAFLESL